MSPARVSVAAVSLLALTLLAGCTKTPTPPGEVAPADEEVEGTKLRFTAPLLANKDGNAYEPGLKVAPDGTLFLHAHKANAAAEGAFLASWLWWSRDDGATWKAVPSPAGSRDLQSTLEGDVAFDGSGHVWFFEHRPGGGMLTSWDLRAEGPVWRSTVPVTAKASYDDRPWLEAYGDGQLLLLSKTPLAPDAATGGPASERLHRSTDGGLTWTMLKAFPGSGWCDLGASPDGQDLVVGCENNELLADSSSAVVWESADGGATWKQERLAPYAAGAANQFVSTAWENGTAWHAWSDDDLSDGTPAMIHLARRGPGGWAELNITNPAFDAERVSVAADAQRVALTMSARSKDGGKGWHPYAIVGPASGVGPWQTVLLDPVAQSQTATSPGDFWQGAFGPDGRLHACYGRIAPVPVAVNVNFRNDLYCVHEART